MKDGNKEIKITRREAIKRISVLAATLPAVSFITGCFLDGEDDNSSASNYSSAYYSGGYTSTYTSSSCYSSYYSSRTYCYYSGYGYYGGGYYSCHYSNSTYYSCR